MECLNIFKSDKLQIRVLAVACMDLRTCVKNEIAIATAFAAWLSDCIFFFE